MMTVSIIKTKFSRKHEFHQMGILHCEFTSCVTVSDSGGLLFNLYVNDVDEGIESFVRKCADDTKMARIVEEQEDALALKRPCCDG